jgi:hypothetical protein
MTILLAKTNNRVSSCRLRTNLGDVISLTVSNKVGDMIVWAGASVSPLQYSGNNLAVLQSVDKLLEISIYVECGV